MSKALNTVAFICLSGCKFMTPACPPETTLPSSDTYYTVVEEYGFSEDEMQIEDVLINQTSVQITFEDKYGNRYQAIYDILPQ